MSPRFAWPVAALLLLALVPTVMNVYLHPAPLEPGALDALLPTEIDGIGSSARGSREAPWIKENYGADDFVTRRFDDIGFFAARSYDAKKLFHFPELGLDYGRGVTKRRIEELETAAGTVPMRVLEFRRSGGMNLSAYVLLYGRRTVRDPVVFLAATIPERFVGRREPMTLIYVQSGADPDDPAPAEARLRSVLAAACTELLR